jgi:nucleotide-binding universal stress UspA family protein
MNTILVATDFSGAASDAVDYAAEMAHVMKAKLILFHTCHVPIIGTEVPVEIETMDDMQKKGMERLSEIAGPLQDHYGNQLQIDLVCKCGFAVDEISRYAGSKKVDLVVMGMHGAGYLSEKLFGSITTALLGESNCPVLVISAGVKFRMIKKIVLACDLENDSRHLPESLKELAQFFHAHIYVLDVVQSSLLVPSEPGEVTDLSTFISQLKDIPHSFHFWKGENAVEGINDFVTRKNMDLVVMMPRRRPFLERVFHPSNTQHMAFHSRVPLLVLRDAENNTN